VVLTRGGAGATAWLRGGQVSVPAGRVTLVDTVGAGDSFIAATLFQLDRMGLLAPSTLGRIGTDEAKAVLEFAVRVAAITCGRVGADPPHLAELEPAG
jgi:fructokinase